MYDIVEHVVDLPANVTEEILSHLLMLEARPLSFSRIPEIKHLATRRVWKRVAVWDREFDGEYRISSRVGDVMSISWSDWFAKMNDSWTPPSLIQSLEVYVPFRASGCVENPKWYTFFEQHVNELSISVETAYWDDPPDGYFGGNGDLQGDDEDDGTELVSKSILPRLDQVPKLKHVGVHHAGGDHPMPEEWDVQIKLPGALKLFYFYTLDADSSTPLDNLKLPEGLTSFRYSLNSDWDEETPILPQLPAGLKKLSLIHNVSTDSLDSSVADGVLSRLVPEGLQELYIALEDDWENDNAGGGVRGNKDVYETFPVPAAVLEDLPPGLKHNLVVQD